MTALVVFVEDVTLIPDPPTIDIRTVLHVGARPENVKTIVDFARRAGLETYVDGDGWNVWGEAPGTDANDAETRHIVLEGENLAGWVWTLVVAKMESEGLPLVPMSSENDRGLLAVVTEYEDFAEDRETFHAAAKTLARA